MKFELRQLVLVHNGMGVVVTNSGKFDVDIALTMDSYMLTLVLTMCDFIATPSGLKK